MKCRHCAFELDLDLIDLGTSPPSNAFLAPSRLAGPEKYFPLRVGVCRRCWLVQTEDYSAAEDLFDAGYLYFSAFSSSWLTHCEEYVADASDRFSLGERSLVVEIAANDGYLLQYFSERDIPCYGVEPTASTAEAARKRGIDIVQEFFSSTLAQRLCRERGAADLIVANNVLAHVPDINDFVAGITCLLKPTGVATFEFPHLFQLVEHSQFDTIYHEHFSYLSLLAVEKIFGAAGLSVFDVKQLPTHGGSLRLFAQRSDTGCNPVHPGLDAVRSLEFSRGMSSADYYRGLQGNAERIKDNFLEFLISAKRRGERVAAYGAAAKGNTLLNFAGVRSDLIAFVVDRNPSKQGKFLPGSRIPVVAETRLHEEKPDWVIVLPWNLKDELLAQLGYVRSWGGQLCIAVPEIVILS